jgi:glycosyltransferase involved in cell wall biosynthesis
MKVTLISTVKDCADHAPAFLASLAAQTRLPDEVVIVDGGSSDGTADAFRTHAGPAMATRPGGGAPVTIIEEPGAGISRGRNVAIARSTHDVIACTDADGELDPGWLAAIVAPIEAGADVSMGITVPITDGDFLRECTAAVNLPLDPAAADPATFMPSARSIAYRRSAIDAVGGYPEQLDTGEDMWVNHRWRDLGLDLRMAPDAVARWRLRPDLGSIWRQYFGYARGDAHGGLYPRRHALRFGVYAGLLLALLSGLKGLRMLALIGAIAYAARPVQRSLHRVSGSPGRRLIAIVAVPALMAWIDVAKMAGYLAGLTTKGSR